MTFASRWSGMAMWIAPTMTRCAGRRKGSTNQSPSRCASSEPRGDPEMSSASPLTNLVSGEAELISGSPRGSELAHRDGDWFVEPFRRPAHLVIVGAIHIAIPLHRLAKVMGYRVTVVDARAKFATKERFPDADELIVAWPDEAMKALTLDNSTYVVILTHDPKFDLPALRAVLGKDVGYIGAIGSRKTNENRFAALREEGFTEEQLSRVHGPVGLDLGGRGAEETALGILAEITAVRFGGSRSFMREVRALR